MSIFNSFKKAFGFPDSYDDENDVDNDADNSSEQNDDGRPRLDLTPPTRMTDDLPEPEQGKEAEKPADNTGETPAETEPEPEVDTTALAAKAFDCVVQLFNGIQPEFVRKCLNTDAQRRYIAEHIDSSLRAALEEATASARRRGQQQWQAERNRLSADLDNMKKQYAAIKQQREKFQNAQLSASRQKRALNDRVHDLENQVAALEAEKEQFQIENRSMANKLRASGVLRDMAAASGAPESDPAVAAELEKTKTALDEQTARAKKLEERTREMEAQIEQQNKERDEMEEEMQKSVAIIDARLANFERIKKKKDTRITQLMSAVKEADHRISQLENSLMEKQRQLDNALAANASMRSGRRSDHPAGASAHNSVSLEIDDLTVYEESGDSNDEPQSSSSKISAIDDLMDNTDWFVAPDPIPLKKDPEVEEQFGYKEPRLRQNRQIDDDKQPSLF